MQCRTIPIAMICDKNFIMQTGVALTSMRENKNSSTIYDVYIIASGCCEEAGRRLAGIENESFRIHIIEEALNQYEEIKQLAHVSKACLHKFDICDLIPQYDKILYLDGDIIVREDLSELYDTELGDRYVAGVAHSLAIITNSPKLNGGVLLFNAKKIRDEHMRQCFIETRQSLGDRKSMDQETFHIVFGDKKVYLPPKFNVMVDKVDYEKKYYSLKDYNAYFGTEYRSRKEIIGSAVIVHFTGAVKPWSYKFAKCADEWYGYYLTAFGDSAEITRKGRLAFWKEEYRKQGIRGLYWLLKDYVLEVLGEHCGVFPDKTYGEWN